MARDALDSSAVRSAAAPEMCEPPPLRTSHTLPFMCIGCGETVLTGSGDGYVFSHLLPPPIKSLGKYQLDILEKEINILIPGDTLAVEVSRDASPASSVDLNTHTGMIQPCLFICEKKIK